MTEVLKIVTCIDSCPNVRPYTKGVDVDTFPTVSMKKDYEVIEILEDSGKSYYRLKGFPKNHVFDTRGFVDYQGDNPF